MIKMTHIIIKLRQAIEITLQNTADNKVTTHARAIHRNVDKHALPHEICALSCTNKSYSHLPHEGEGGKYLIFTSANFSLCT